MKKMIFVIALVAIVGFADQALGELCNLDNVPAATLLIPYFEAGITPGACLTGPTTYFSINNASDGPVIAHVTYWTDYSVPEIDFDVYLTGYDVQVINVQDVFCTGSLPQTGVGTLMSPTGPFSPNAGVFPNCGNTVGDPPYYDPVAVSAKFLAHLRAVFTGAPSPVTGLCGGDAIGSGNAHGYITVDATRDCSLRFPGDPLYWTSGTPYIDESGNVLWGDYAYINRSAGTSEAFAATHIEAFGVLSGNGPTFYGRYLAGIYSDAREPLPTTWGARYNRGGGFAGTWFQVWREADASAVEVPCGTRPWLTATCGQGIDFSSDPNPLVAFNESEQVELPSSGASGEPNPELTCIPLETQSIEVGVDIPTSYLQGWYYMNLQNTLAPAASLSLGQGRLTVVEVLSINAGLFSGGWEGVALDGSCSQFAAGVTVVPAQPTALNPQAP